MENIFSTQERLAILEAVILRTEIISVNGVAAELKLSKGLISKYFDILAREGILKKTGGKFLVNGSAAIVKGIKVLLAVRGIDIRLFKRYPFIRSAGLYGSCVKGENTADSDVDLWLMIDDNADETKLAGLTSALNKKITNVKVLYLTGPKLERLKAGDTLFAHALAFGSIVLYGDKDALQV